MNGKQRDGWKSLFVSLEAKFEKMKYADRDPTRTEQKK
jgi:hypothetical protein